jgi:hypothetical protein
VHLPRPIFHERGKAMGFSQFVHDPLGDALDGCVYSSAKIDGFTLDLFQDGVQGTIQRFTQVPNI